MSEQPDGGGGYQNLYAWIGQRKLDRYIRLVYSDQQVLIIQNNLRKTFSEVMKMAGKDDKSCCDPVESNKSCCKIEAIVSVDDRGQMVLPKEIRAKANINAGDKLALICWERNGEVCCISMVKVEELAGGIKRILGPVMKDIMQE